jgi:hypothetical protein
MAISPNARLPKGTQMSLTPRYSNRLAVLGAMVGGAAWIVSGTLQLTAADSVRGETVETLAAHLLLGMLAAALVATIPAVLALSDRARTRRPAYLAVAGQLVLACAATTSNVVGHDPLFFLVAAPLGNLMWLAGSIGLAVSLWRAGTVPRAVAVGLPLVQIVSLPLSAVGGGLIGGAYWIAVASLLNASQRSAAAPRPATA